MPKGVYIRSDAARLNIGKASKGRKNQFLVSLNKTEEHRKLVSKTMQHRQITEETRLKKRQIALALGQMPPHYKGKDHYNWQGGITPANEQERHTQEVLEWKRTVLVRDNFTCQMCFQHGGKLQINHIRPWAKYPALRCEINNGITLCVSCHKKITRHETEWEQFFDEKIRRINNNSESSCRVTSARISDAK